MEKSMEDLEVDIRIANARAEVAIGLVRTLIQELSGVVDWSEQDLFRSYWHSFDDNDPARDIVLLEMGIISAYGDEANPGEAAGAYHRKRERLEHEVRKELKQQRRSPS